MADLGTIIGSALFERILNATLGDPVRKAARAQQIVGLARESLGQGIPTSKLFKPKELEQAVGPQIAGALLGFEKTDAFKQSMQQRAEQAQFRQGLQAILQAPAFRTPGQPVQIAAPVSGAVQPGTVFAQQQGAPQVTSSPTLIPGITRITQPSKADIAVREAQLAPAVLARRTARPALGELAERRLQRLMDVAEGKVSARLTRAREAAISRRMALEVAGRYVALGANPGQVDLIARGFQTGKMDPKVADLINMGGRSLQEQQAVVEGLVRYEKFLQQAPKDFATKDFKRLERDEKAPAFDAAHAGLIRTLLRKHGGNVAAAEAEYRIRARFVSEDGKRLVRLAKLPEKLRNAEIATFRDFVQRVGTGGTSSGGFFDADSFVARWRQETLGEGEAPAPAPAAVATPQVPPGTAPVAEHPSIGLSPDQFTRQAEATKRIAIRERELERERIRREIEAERQLRRGRIGPLGPEP